jgi:hypothetical protein
MPGFAESRGRRYPRRLCRIAPSLPAERKIYSVASVEDTDFVQLMLPFPWKEMRQK